MCSQYEFIDNINQINHCIDFKWNQSSLLRFRYFVIDN